MHYKKILLIILISLNCNAFSAEKNSVATQNSAIQNFVNRFVAKYSDAGIEKKGEGFSGVQVAVLQDGQLQIFSAGTVGRHINSPVTAENLFAWGSITKAFTAAIILKLQEEKKLNLQQTLQEWFPENFITSKNKPSLWPTEWAHIKIFQLLNMTSGIPNVMNNATFGENKLWNKKTIFETNWQPNQLMQVAAEYARSGHCFKKCFAAGTRWAYSNTNYILASLIAEKADNKAFSVQLQTLLNKAHITAYYIPHERPQRSLHHMMHGYFYYPDAIPETSKIKGVPNGFDTSNTLVWSINPASGALIGNIQNIAQAILELFNDQILSKNSTEILKNDYFVNKKTGAPCGLINASNARCYGLGVQAEYNRSLGTVFLYDGLILGYRSMYYWAPQENTLVVATVNSSPGHHHFARFVFNIFINLAVNALHSMKTTQP